MLFHMDNIISVIHPDRLLFTTMKIFILPMVALAIVAKNQDAMPGKGIASIVQNNVII